MWLAETSITDGIAIVIFPMVSFLILLGMVAFVRWFFRLISGHSVPAAVKVGSSSPHSESAVMVPEKWSRLWRHSRMFTASGMVGLSSWELLGRRLNLTENDFRDTALGSVSAWLVGILLISGLCLQLACRIKMRSLARRAGFPMEESSTSVILKYVLLLVIAFFGFVLLVTA